MNCAPRSLIRNLTDAARWPRFRKLRAGCVVHSRWVRGDAGQADAADAMLDDDQGVDAPQEHGVHVDEVGREDAGGLGGQELLPRRAAAAWCGADTGIVQNLPHRGRRDGRPSFVSSPWIRRYPHTGFSFASRTTRRAMLGTVGGRPGLRCLLVSSTVSGSQKNNVYF